MRAIAHNHIPLFTSITFHRYDVIAGDVIPFITLEIGMAMISAAAWGKRYGVSRQWAADMVRNGRVEGAVFDGLKWQVPEDAPLPSRLTPGRVPNPDSPAIQRERSRAHTRAVKAALREERSTAREKWTDYVLNAEQFDHNEMEVWRDVVQGITYKDFGQKVNFDGQLGAIEENWDADLQGFYEALIVAFREGKIGRPD